MTLAQRLVGLLRAEQLCQSMMLVRARVLVAQRSQVNQASEGRRDLRKSIAPQIGSGAAIEFHLRQAMLRSSKVPSLYNTIAHCPLESSCGAGTRTKSQGLFYWRKKL